MAGEPRWWGWHQLDSGWADRLVADAAVVPGDLVLDVGAGAGVLTALLVARGARVVAVELHPGRAARLRDRFADDRVRVVCADATDLRLPRRPFKVVSNPPFAATTALLRRLTAPGSRLERADVVVPTHVARRWSDGLAPGAARWGSTFDARRTGAVPARAFRPPAPCAASVLVLERRGGPVRSRR